MGDTSVQAAGTLDLDTDGMPDAWETQNLGGTHSSASDDMDSDGMSNLAEYLSGTDPSNASDRLLVEISRSDTHAVVSTPTINAAGLGYAGTERYYRLESNTALTETAWVGVANFTNVLGTNQLIQYTNVPNSAQGSFRAKVWLDRP